MSPDQVDATPALRDLIGELAMRLAHASAIVVALQAENALLRAALLTPPQEVSRGKDTNTHTAGQAGPQPEGPAGHA